MVTSPFPLRDWTFPSQSWHMDAMKPLLGLVVLLFSFQLQANESKVKCGPLLGDEPAVNLPAGTMPEDLTDGWGYYVLSKERLAQFRSEFQDIEVHDTEAFGRLFRLDGHFMTSEKDEFYYHENLVHPAAITHPDPKKVLIIGGGDGGTADELFKHPSIESVTLCEIDPAVIDISRRYMQNVHHGSLDNPKLNIRIGDGFAFVRNTNEKFDLIILDLTDPGGPSLPLYTADFYRACADRLCDGGALTLHIASPTAHPDRIQAGLSRLREAFPNVTPYLVNVPLYGGPWMMACASKDLDPKTMTEEEVEMRLKQRGITNLQYYNGEMHRAAMALPGFIKKLTKP